MNLIETIRRYLAHDDPLAAVVNKVALILAADGPFYPPTVWGITGPRGWPSLLILITTPFFAAVPWITRRSSVLGRALFCLVSAANIVWTAKLLGMGSGVELFLIPCITLSAMLFHRSERFLMLPLVGLPFLIFFYRNQLYATSFATLTADDQTHLLSVNAFSAAALTAALGFIFSGLYAGSVKKG